MRLALLACLLLCGCAAWPSLEKYEPQTAEVNRVVLYEADKTFCRAFAATHRPRFNLAAVGTSTLIGAAQRIGDLALTPVAPVFGALDGAGSSTIAAFDPTDSGAIKVFLKCLESKVAADQSATMADPND